MNWLQGLLSTDETGTTSQHVAQTLASGNADNIQNLMQQHRVVTAPGGAGVTNWGVRDTTNNIGHRWRPGEYLGWMRPHRIRTFELFPNPAPGTPNITATNIPMTPRNAWGAAQDLTNPGGALGATNFTNVAPGLGITGELSGCSLIRNQHGSIGHLRPPRLQAPAPQPLDGVQAENTLALQPNVHGVFGPVEYNRRRGAQHQRSNAIILHNGGGGAQTVVSQSIHMAGGNNRTITAQRHQL